MNALQEDLEKKVMELRESVNAEVKVAVHDLKNGNSASVYGIDAGWAASIIKVPILVTASQDISKGRLSLDTKLEVNHKYTLEQRDFVSMQPEGSMMKVSDLLYYMIVHSDNEATNMVADKISVERINESMWNLGLENTMLGHLLCSNVHRYTSSFNTDGSNITCPDDMVKIMRHIYDRKYSKLTSEQRLLSNVIMSFTSPWLMNVGAFKDRKIKGKEGYIHDYQDGSDIHEVSIVDKETIVCIMLNKVHQKKSTVPKLASRSRFSFAIDNFLDYNGMLYSDILNYYFSYRSKSSPFRAFREIVEVIYRNKYYSNSNIFLNKHFR